MDQNVLIQMEALKEMISLLMEEIRNLQNDLKENNTHMEKLKFRLSELEERL